MREPEYAIGDRVRLDLEFMDEVGKEMYGHIGKSELVGEVVGVGTDEDCALPDEPVYSVRFPEGTVAMCFEGELLTA